MSVNRLLLNYFGAVILVLGSTSVSSADEEPKHEPDSTAIWERLRARLMSYADRWYGNRPDLAPEHLLETDDDFGVVALYNRLGGVLGPQALEAVLGRPIYVSGPHDQRGIRSSSHESFGHYDSEAIQMINEEVDKLYDAPFVAVTQSLYDDEFKALGRHFNEAFRYWEGNPDELARHQQAYQAHLKAGTLETAAFPPEGDVIEQLLGLYSANSEDRNRFLTALQFWLRRSIDGTMDEFVSVLQKTLRAYDPKYFEKFGFPRTLR